MDSIYSFCEVLHKRAESIEGKFILAGFKEIHRISRSPLIDHFDIGCHKMMAATALKWVNVGYNVHTSLSLMRKDLAYGKKGRVNDVVAVLGLVADFDGGKGVDWATRIPTNYKPDLVLETSPGNAQCFFLLDSPITIACDDQRQRAKALAAAFKSACSGVDDCVSDISHVWRMPDTKNFPTQHKINAGRDPNPFPVSVISHMGDIL